MPKIFLIWAWNYAWWYASFQNSFHGLILRLTWTLQWSLLNVRIWTFNWVWHEHCNDLFNIRNLVGSLILMFVRICLCDTILDTWFGKKWKRLEKFWGWKIYLVYAYYFKHLSLSMLIDFMLIKKNVFIILTSSNNITYSYKYKIKNSDKQNFFYCQSRRTNLWKHNYIYIWSLSRIPNIPKTMDYPWNHDIHKKQR